MDKPLFMQLTAKDSLAVHYSLFHFKQSVTHYLQFSSIRTSVFWIFK